MRCKRCSKHKLHTKPKLLVITWLCHSICISVLVGMQTIPTYSLITASTSIRMTYSSANLFCSPATFPSIIGTVTNDVYGSAETVTDSVYNSDIAIMPIPNACAPPAPIQSNATVTSDVYDPLESKEMEGE